MLCPRAAFRRAPYRFQPDETVLATHLVDRLQHALLERREVLGTLEIVEKDPRRRSPIRLPRHGSRRRPPRASGRAPCSRPAGSVSSCRPAPSRDACSHEPCRRAATPCETSRCPPRAGRGRSACRGASRFLCGSAAISLARASATASRSPRRTSAGAPTASRASWTCSSTMRGTRSSTSAGMAGEPASRIGSRAARQRNSRCSSVRFIGCAVSAMRGRSLSHTAGPRARLAHGTSQGLHFEHAQGRRHRIRASGGRAGSRVVAGRPFVEVDRTDGDPGDRRRGIRRGDPRPRSDRGRRGRSPPAIYRISTRCSSRRTPTPSKYRKRWPRPD